jgi:hypothetical protein
LTLTRAVHRCTLAAILLSLLALGLFLPVSPAFADDPQDAAQPSQPKTYTDAEEQSIALELTNPVANLISVPIQNNFDFGGGFEGKGLTYSLVAQPVLPIRLNSQWNLIARTIIPFADLNNVLPTRQTGLGDIVQQFFLSPSQPTSSGIVWGAGPVFSYPTATNHFTGSGQWGAGPSGVVVRLAGDWTNFLLVSHLWGIAPPSDRRPLNITLIQPAVAYTFPTHTTVFVSSESSYDWTRRQWVVPLQLGGNQLLLWNGQLFQLGGLVRYYAEKPQGGADWGFQLRLTLVFPK